MKKINVKARIKRNMLAELSDEYFRDEDSEIIAHLNSQGKNARVGVQREDGVYTVVGEDKVYYSTPHDIKSEISINKF